MIQNKKIKQALSEDGFCITRFSGNSMMPFLNEDTDELLISNIKTKPAVGDIVLFSSKDSFTLHRIVSKSWFGYVTKGDNNSRSDGHISKRRILGKLEGYWRNGQYVQVYKTEYFMRIADLDVRVLGSEREKNFCRDYVVSSGRTAALTLDMDVLSNIEQLYDMNTKPLATEENRLMSQFSYNSWKFGILVLHSSAVLMDGKAYVFAGPSGIGKSTHAKLLADTFGDKAKIINGDKAVLKLIDGKPVVFGCPWAGRERWQLNISAPLGGVVILDRAGEAASTIEKVTGPEVFNRLVSQLYMDLKDISHLDDVLALCDEIFKDIPIYYFKAAKSESAAKLSYMTLTGKTGQEGKKQAVSDQEWELEENYED